MAAHETELRPRARAIAFYLPQFHPIPENDAWWGEGFTEWTNVTRARPLFRGHEQPREPGALGYYDLRLPEVRAAQAALARAHGVEAFCYYHYWFAGRRLLERPFAEVLASGRPDLGFCLCWANESWSGVWHGAPDRILIEQTYPGESDERAHFEQLLPALRDPRYLSVDGKPLFLVYSPGQLPEPRRFAAHFRALAARAGLPGLFLLGHQNPPWDPERDGFDGAVLRSLDLAAGALGWEPPRPLAIARRVRGMPQRIYRYADLLPHLAHPAARRDDVYGCMIPNWDNSPRSGVRATVVTGSTPTLFERHARQLVQQAQAKPPERRLVFVKSWNEWAEGNFLEPDRTFGGGYLEALRRALS